MKKTYAQHVHLICRDLQGQIDFWSKAFGAALVEMRSFGGADGAVMDLNSVTKLYFKVVDCEPQGTGTPRAGTEHLGVIVDDLDETIALVKTLPGGALVKEPFMSGPLRCAFISGPEGVLVEIMQEPA